MNTTDLEKKMILATRWNDYANGDDYGDYTFAAIDASGIDANIARGVIASLVKKELVVVADMEETTPDGSPLTIIKLTSSGKTLCDTLE